MPLSFRDRQKREPAPAPPEPLPPLSPEDLFENGLLAGWYMEYRLAAEMERAQRYERPLTVLGATPALLPGERPAAELLQAGVSAARGIARSTDLLGWGRDFSLLIIMPETDPEGAEAAASRWQTDLYLKTHTAGAKKWKVSAFDANQFQTADELLAPSQIREASP